MIGPLPSLNCTSTLLKTTLLGINKTTLLGITHFKVQNDYAKNLGRAMAPWLAYVYKHRKSTKLKCYFDLNVYLFAF